jgi:hypothetical protein
VRLVERVPTRTNSTFVSLADFHIQSFRSEKLEGALIFRSAWMPLRSLHRQGRAVTIRQSDRPAPSARKSREFRRHVASPSYISVPVGLLTPFPFIGDGISSGYSSEPNRRRRTAPAFDSKQRPWLMMMRSGCHEKICSTEAFVFRFCRRSGPRIPKKIWPRG